MIDTSHLSDVQIVACTLYGEARSEPTEGILAVACVIRNRVTTDYGNDEKPDWWGEGYRGVCLKKWQFSCWLPEGGEANHARLAKLVAALKAGTVTDERYKECAWIATGVVNNWVRDVTHGADHYHAVSMQPRPTWALNRVPINHLHPPKPGHVFYRLAPKRAA
jgi:N-acetylmuramoyl-L-alanine amidase